MEWAEGGHPLDSPDPSPIHPSHHIHIYAPVANPWVWVMCSMYAICWLWATLYLCVSYGRGPRARCNLTFHYVFLLLALLWLPLRCLVFFASNEDTSNWVEIVYLLPTTVQFAGFGLWVLYFAYLTGSSLLPTLLAGNVGIDLETEGSEVAPVSATVDVRGGLQMLANGGASQAAAGVTSPTLGPAPAPRPAGGGSGSSAAYSVSDGACRCCGLSLSPATVAYGTAVLVLGALNVIEVALTLQSASSRYLVRLVAIMQPGFSAAVYTSLGLLLSRFASELWRLDAATYAKTRLPRSHGTTLALSIVLACLFLGRAAYDVSQVVPQTLIRLDTFPPVKAEHVAFFGLVETLPVALALALTAEDPPVGWRRSVWVVCKCGRVEAACLACAGPACCKERATRFVEWRLLRRMRLQAQYDGALLRDSAIQEGFVPWGEDGASGSRRPGHGGGGSGWGRGTRSRALGGPSGAGGLSSSEASSSQLSRSETGGNGGESHQAGVRRPRMRDGRTRMHGHGRGLLGGGSSVSLAVGEGLLATQSPGVGGVGGAGHSWGDAGAGRRRAHTSGGHSAASVGRNHVVAPAPASERGPGELPMGSNDLSPARRYSLNGPTDPRSDAPPSPWRQGTLYEGNEQSGRRSQDPRSGAQYPHGHGPRHPPPDVVHAMLPAMGGRVGRDDQGAGSVQRPPQHYGRPSKYFYDDGDRQPLGGRHSSGLDLGRQSPLDLLGTLGFDEDGQDGYNGGRDSSGGGGRSHGFGGGYRALLFGGEDDGGGESLRKVNSGGVASTGSRSGRRLHRTRSRSSRNGSRSQRRPSHRSQRSSRSGRSLQGQQEAAPASDSDEPHREVARDSDSPNDGRRVPHALHRLWSKDAPRPGAERAPPVSDHAVRASSTGKQRTQVEPTEPLMLLQPSDAPSPSPTPGEDTPREQDMYPFLQESPSAVGGARGRRGSLIGESPADLQPHQASSRSRRRGSNGASRVASADSGGQGLMEPLLQGDSGEDFEDQRSLASRREDAGPELPVLGPCEALQTILCGSQTVAYDWMDEFADWLQYFPDLEGEQEEGTDGTDAGLRQAMLRQGGGRLAAMAVVSMYRDVEVGGRAGLEGESGAATDTAHSVIDGRGRRTDASPFSGEERTDELGGALPHFERGGAYARSASSSGFFVGGVGGSGVGGGSGGGGPGGMPERDVLGLAFREHGGPWGSSVGHRSGETPAGVSDVGQVSEAGMLNLVPSGASFWSSEGDRASRASQTSGGGRLVAPDAASEREASSNGALAYRPPQSGRARGTRTGGEGRSQASQGAASTRGGRSSSSRGRAVSTSSNSKGAGRHRPPTEASGYSSGRRHGSPFGARPRPSVASLVLRSPRASGSRGSASESHGGGSATGSGDAGGGRNGGVGRVPSSPLSAGLPPGGFMPRARPRPPGASSPRAGPAPQSPRFGVLGAPGSPGSQTGAYRNLEDLRQQPFSRSMGGRGASPRARPMPFGAPARSEGKLGSSLDDRAVSLSGSAAAAIQPGMSRSYSDRSGPLRVRYGSQRHRPLLSTQVEATSGHTSGGSGPSRPSNTQPSDAEVAPGMPPSLDLGTPQILPYMPPPMGPPSPMEGGRPGPAAAIDVEMGRGVAARSRDGGGNRWAEDANASGQTRGGKGGRRAEPSWGGYVPEDYGGGSYPEYDAGQDGR